MNTLWPVVQNNQVIGYTMTSHQRLAIRAAQRGNWKAADSLELQYLADQLNHHDGCEEHCAWCRLCSRVASDVVPVAILRRYGPRCVDCVEWTWTGACKRCTGEGKLLLGDEWDDDEYFNRCRDCDGTGRNTRWLVTDLDGNFIEDDIA